MVKRTGGTFAGRAAAIASGAWPCYFLAAGLSDARKLLLPDDRMVYRNILLPMNGLPDSSTEALEGMIGRGVHLLIDSGVFDLAMRHAKAHDLPYYVALTVPPDAVDGFDALFARYVGFCKRLGEKVWGYVEFDQGGREAKIRTRAKLEALGLRPIPVYHPLSDGWDYFDELAQSYDRICIGNVVMASPTERRRLVATLWQRKRKYPHVWLHLLGYTPNEFLNAFPMDSADSSTWLRMIRWAGSHKEKAMLRGTTGLPLNFRYRLGEPGAEAKPRRMAAYTFGHDISSYRAHLRACESLGFDLLPPLE